MEAFKPIKDYLRAKYACHEERTDLYAYFVERGLSLLRSSGLFGMIVSNKFVRAKYGRPLRSFIVENGQVLRIADFAGARVFQGATVRTIVLVVQRGLTDASHQPRYTPVPSIGALRSMEAGTLSVFEYANERETVISAGALGKHEWTLIPESCARVLDKLRASSAELCTWGGCRALFGLKTGLNEAFVIDSGAQDELVRKDPRSIEVLRPILFGKDVRRYHTCYGGRVVIYCHPDRNVDEYPAVREHLASYRQRLRARAGPQEWYELQQPAVGLLDCLGKPRILYPIIAPECRFTLDSSESCINDKCFLLPTGDRALLGILNSRVANFYFASVCAALEGAGERYFEFRAQYVDHYPVPEALSAPECRDPLTSLVQQMLDLHKQLSAAKTPHEKAALQRQIEATDRQIDQLVYELYGLTDDEIRIVEEATS